MRRIFQLSEFQSAAGHWHVGNYNSLTREESKWYAIPRFLGISLADYVWLLTEKYNATVAGWTEYNNGKSPFLYYYWKNYSDAHKFLLDMNKMFRKKKVFVDF